MKEFGEYLKSQREKRGIRLEEIASITKIHLSNLEILERGQLEKLPPEPFLRGFITAYCKYIGLSSAEALGKYNELRAPTEVNVVKAEIPEPPAVRSASGHDPRGGGGAIVWSPIRLVAGFSVVAVITVSIFLIQLGKSAPPDSLEVTAVLPTPSPTVATQEIKKDLASEGIVESSRQAASETPKPKAEEPKPTTPSPTVPKTQLAQAIPAAVDVPTPQGPAQVVAHELKVTVKERSWAKIVTDNSPPKELFLEPGVESRYEAVEKIKLVLGNSSGATILHNSEQVDGTKLMGTVRTYRFPASAKFPQDPPKPLAAATPQSDQAEGSNQTAKED